MIWYIVNENGIFGVNQPFLVIFGQNHEYFKHTLARRNIGLQKIRNFGKFSDFLWPALPWKDVIFEWKFDFCMKPDIFYN